VIKDPFEKYDHMKGYHTLEEYLASEPPEDEKEHAFEQLRRFMEEPGGPYDYDAFFASIPRENIKAYLRGWGLIPNSDEKVASSGGSSV
jgi:hypothetical protein